MSWAEIGSILWGLVSAPRVNEDTSDQYQYIRSHRLMLPGLLGVPMGDYVTTADSMYLPGAQFASNALAGAYSVGSGSIYSGDLSLALGRQWQEMSTSASEAANIINLVWTDVAANAVIGTRSWLPSPRLPPNLQETPISQNHSGDGLPLAVKQENKDRSTHTYVPVHIVKRRVAFDWSYGIPALLVLVLFAAIAGATLFATFCGRVRVSRIRWILNNLSAGRLLAKHLEAQPGEAATLSTKQWIRSYGAVEVDLGSVISQKVEAQPHPAYSPIRQEEESGGPMS